MNILCREKTVSARTRGRPPKISILPAKRSRDTLSFSPQTNDTKASNVVTAEIGSRCHNADNSNTKPENDPDYNITSTSSKPQVIMKISFNLICFCHVVLHITQFT